MTYSYVQQRMYAEKQNEKKYNNETPERTGTGIRP